MADLDKSVIARLRKGKVHFEIMVDSDKALEFRAGKVELGEAIATEDIYTDVRKGVRATKEQKLAAFHTDDAEEIAAIIIREGEIPLTTEHKNKLTGEMRKKVVALLHKHAVDGKTGLPHPAERIERAMEQKHIKVDWLKPAEKQMQEVAKKLQDLLPLRFEMRSLSIKVPSQYSAQAFGLIKNLGNMTRGDWQSDGSLLAMLEIPAGIQPDVEDAVHKLTKGAAEIRIVGKK